MTKVIAFIIEMVFWLQLFLAPVLLAGAIAVVIYASSSEKVVWSIVIALIGVVWGIIFAERIRRKYGCSNYISRLFSSST